MTNLSNILMPAIIILVALVILGLIFARLYKRSSKETSFVRTGFGGEKIILNGGALVFPILHEIIPVNMNTLRLEVRRANDQALITKDRMRVDVIAEFYVRVKPSQESIADAAQTLGRRTMYPDELKALVEGKFVDALRAVAAEMEMTQLHEKRVDFVRKVQEVVYEDLIKNGLELESVSLTGLDQTSREFFNPNNAFDAEGLTKLTDEIESRRKIRNDIEQSTKIAIAKKDLEAERQQLEIKRDGEYAKLDQEREVAIRQAAQSAEIATEEAEKKREADEADIQAKKAIDLANIAADRAVQEQEIEKERVILEQRILKERSVETAEVERRKTIELAEQVKAIAIAEKSKEQSEAQAEADIAKQHAVKEHENIETVRDTEIAEREKAVELVKARELAEQQVIKLTAAAEAEKLASQDTAESILILANAESDKKRIAAQASADSIKLLADADRERYKVDSDGKKSLNEAANTLSEEQISMQIKIELMARLPEIIRQSVKPMEQIDGIKIFQIDGLNGGSSSGTSDNNSSGNTNLADTVVNSALKYRTHAPLVDSLLDEIGLKGSDINGLVAGINDMKGKDKT